MSSNARLSEEDIVVPAHPSLIDCTLLVCTSHFRGGASEMPVSHSKDINMIKNNHAHTVD